MSFTKARFSSSFSSSTSVCVADSANVGKHEGVVFLHLLFMPSQLEERRVAYWFQLVVVVVVVVVVPLPFFLQIIPITVSFCWLESVQTWLVKILKFFGHF